MITLIDDQVAKDSDRTLNLTTPTITVQNMLTKLVQENSYILVSETLINTEYPCCPDDSPSDISVTFMVTASQHQSNKNEVAWETEQVRIITSLQVFQDFLTLMHKEFG